MDTKKKTRTHFRTCNLCEAMCGIAIDLEDNKIIKIRGDKDDPFSKGFICPKAVALQDIYNDPDRLKHPVRRVNGNWEKISWQEAFDEVTSKIKEIQRKYGRNSVGIYQGNPTVHNSGTMLFAPLFFRTLRTKNRFSATSVDQLPHHIASYFMFGNQLMLPIPDIDRTDYFLILGANPIASNGSMMTAPGFVNRLKELQNRGGKFVVIDPRKTETAAKADEHHFIIPGSDVFFLLAILNTVFKDKLSTPGRLLNFTEGLEDVKDIVSDFPPESVEQRTGISAKIIKKIAYDFCEAKSAVCYGRVGVSTQAFGSLCQWLINVLNIVTDNMDKSGGAMFTLPAIDAVKQAVKDGKAGHYAKWKSRVNDLPEFAGELPVSVLADEILTKGEGQIKAMITSAGNPVLSTPNGRKLEKAFCELEFMVSIDIYINETTKNANIILPPTTGLETEHYDLAFHFLAVRNTAKYSTALFEPENGTMHDWQIFNELRKRMSSSKKQKNISGWIKKKLTDRLTPEKMLDLGLKLGPYGIWGGRFLSKNGLSLKKLKQNVHGIDLGPLKECLPNRLFTKDKKINLSAEIFKNDIKRAKENLQASEPDNNFNLLLIGRRHLRSNNSWMHNSKRLVNGKDRCTLFINPKDAESNNIEDGNTVNVNSKTGLVKIKAEITKDIKPGVVSIPHGWGHNRSGIVLNVAKEHSGVSINDLTDDNLIDKLSGNAAFSGVPVKVSPY
ncbi:MAG: molybdopterin-dependent oxidoreductase [Bacteroidetes bacterium]|nr:molybdopterin-dependent oxidoreductase [Bacteroidota bacterium]